MNLDHDFFQVSKLSEDQKKSTSLEDFFSQNSSEDQKKRSSPKLGDFFSTNSYEDQRSDVVKSKTVGGDADVEHTQIIGGDTVKILGGYIPPGFRHPCWKVLSRCAFFGSRSSYRNEKCADRPIVNIWRCPVAEG